MSLAVFHHGGKILTRCRLRIKFFGNYGYICNRTKNNVIYVECQGKDSMNCRARGKVINDRLTLSRNHNHCADRRMKLLYNFETSLYKMIVSQRTKSIRTIYDEISCEHYEAATYAPWATMQVKMQGWRKRIRPPIPNSLNDLIVTLQIPEWNRIYTVYEQGRLTVTTVSDTDNSSSTIFCDVAFLRSLNITELIIDSTFKITPKQPKVCQFFTILGLIDDTVIPIFWALMERKSCAAYVAVLSYFARVCAPHLIPTTIMMDFESAITGAVQLVYPTATSVHCFFHFCQALMKKAKRLRILGYVITSEEAQILFRKLMALALLPPEHICLAYMWLLNNCSIQTLRVFDVFFQYFENQWLRDTMRRKISVFRVKNRTNNFIESYHRVLHLRFGAHPTIWTLLEHIKNLQITTILEKSTLQLGNIVRRHQRLNEKTKNKIIDKSWNLYNRDIQKIPDFLECASHYLTAFNENVLKDEQLVDQYFI